MTQKKPLPKWLLLPPAVALLLLLGPLSMQGGSARAATTAAATPAPQQPEPEAAAPAVAPLKGKAPLNVPRGPDLAQMASALVGVLVLGGAAVWLVRRVRGGAQPTRGTPLATLRQTLRLSAKQAVHAIEFDDRILLVGENERGLALLDSGKLPERVADELEVLARHTAPAHGHAAAAATAHSAAADDADEEGATPKNLVIPRPANPGPRRLPTPPATPAPAAAAQRSAPGLADFRALLQKAGRA